MEPLKITFPLGIGDCYWACQKLKALREVHPDQEIWAYTNTSPDHRSDQFMKLVDYIDHAEYSQQAVRDVHLDMEDTYLHRKWWTRETCKNWRIFDYIMVPNGAVEVTRIEDFWPDLETEYDVPITLGDEARDMARTLFGEGSVILYPSGLGPNKHFHNHWWSAEDWIETIKLLNKAGIVPHLMGAHTQGDLGYKEVLRKAGLSKTLFIDRIGQTTISEALAAIQSSRVWAGFPSGLGVLSASFRKNTIMFWADRSFPIPGAISYPNVRSDFQPSMQTAWLNEEQQKTYYPLSFGDRENLNPINLARLIEKLAND